MGTRLSHDDHVPFVKQSQILRGHSRMAVSSIFCNLSDVSYGGRSNWLKLNERKIKGERERERGGGRERERERERERARARGGGRGREVCVSYTRCVQLEVFQSSGHRDESETFAFHSFLQEPQTPAEGPWTSL